MAFTTTENAAIRRYLGYADERREYFWSLNSILSSIGSDTETSIRGLLEQLATIESTLVTGWSRAGLKRVEDVEFYQGAAGATDLRAEGDRLVYQIAHLLNVEVKHSAFSGAPAAGLCGRG